MITWEEITSTRRWTKASTGKRHTLSSDAIFRRNLFTHSKDIKRELRIFSSSRELGTYYYLLQWITSSSSGKLTEREDFWEHMTGIPRASGKLIWRSKVCQSSNAKILIKNFRRKLYQRVIRQIHQILGHWNWKMHFKIHKQKNPIRRQVQPRSGQTTYFPCWMQW